MWRERESNILLEDKGIVETCREKLSYFLLNTGTIYPIVVWEAFKVTIRGVLTCQDNYRNKQKNKEDEFIGTNQISGSKT